MSKDDASKLVGQLRSNADVHHEEEGTERRRAADMIERLATRMIVRTVKELDALPAESVVRAGRIVWEYDGASWSACGYEDRCDSDRLDLPATVLFTPTESGEPQ